MWRDVNNTDGETRLKFLTVLKRCEDYAELSDMSSILRLIDKGCGVYYWQGEGFELALAIRFGDKTKIVIGVPSPEGDGESWCKEIIRKVREELDSRGIKEFYATQLDCYKSDHMQEFAETLGKLSPEFDEEEVGIGTRRMKFSRKDDDCFKGKCCKEFSDRVKHRKRIREMTNGS